MDLGEDLSTENNQAERDAWQAEQEARIRKESLQKFGVMPISKVILPRVAANPVTQQEYNCRLYALLNIVRTPELSDARYPLSESWQALYPNIPYNSKATNWKISKKDSLTILNLMKELGVYKRFRMDGVASVVREVHRHHQTQEIERMTNELEQKDEHIRKLELLINNESGNMTYRGVKITRLARTFKAEMGDFVLTTRHGTFDKMNQFLEQIDKLLAVQN